MGRKKHKKFKQKKQERVPHMHNEGHYYKKFCHEGPIEVFKVGSSTIYGGSQFEIETSPIAFDLYIVANGLKGEIIPPVVIRDVRRLLVATTEETFTRVTPSSVILDIVDGSVPNVGPRFWKSLVTDIRDKRLQVAVFCQGGHGRTGVVLACLAHYGGLVDPKKDMLSFLRSVFCSEAIETNTQIAYLKQMGMHTTQGVSWQPVTSNYVVTPHPQNLQGTAIGVPSLSSPPGNQTIAEVLAMDTPGGLTAIKEKPELPKISDTELMEWEKEMILEHDKQERKLWEGGE